VIGGISSIGCSYGIRKEIARCLQPPFEELFDTAEEYSIKELYVAWTQMITVDMKTYGKVSLYNIKLEVCMKTYGKVSLYNITLEVCMKTYGKVSLYNITLEV
jgi:flavin-binding protein dodecin